MEESSAWKIREAVLETVCGVTSTLPSHAEAEIAFAGKSNVGKSSLINALLIRKSYARTSSKPGKTQTINYYRINSGETREDFAPDVYLVDLPGYGYAEVSEAAKAAWGRMIERYLRTSRALKCVCLLVDIRHAPSANDRQMYDWIVESGRMPVIIATKKDKVKKTELDRCLKVIRTELKVGSGTPLIPFSSASGEGRDEVWDLIREAAAGHGK